MTRNPLGQFVIVLIVVVAAAVLLQSNRSQSNSADDVSDSTTATLETTLGTISIGFYVSDAPKAVANFVGLARKGYYDGLSFHRVVKDFVIQTGDPTGTGSGGESLWGKPFDDELNPQTESYKRGYVAGVVAMANSGPNTNGSQFFIVAGDDVSLPNKYTIFGYVKSGLDVVKTINAVETDQERPKQDVTITKVTIQP